MFVSTVRSRHLLQSLSDKQQEGEFGFLSEEKLLNTALTRAKSWLGVVGDPVALCTVGECSKIWKTYLKHCEKLGGIMPKGFKLEDVWMLVRQNASTVVSAVVSDIGPPFSASRNSSTLLSKELGVYKQAHSMNTVAQLPAVSQRHQDNNPASETHRENSENVLLYNTEGQNRCVTKLDAGETSGNSGAQRDAHTKSAAQPKNSKGKKQQDFLSFEDWSLDYQMEPDEIISQLAKVSLSSIHLSCGSELVEQKLYVCNANRLLPCTLIHHYRFAHCPIHLLCSQCCIVTQSASVAVTFTDYLSFNIIIVSRLLPSHLLPAYSSMVYK